MAAQKPSIPKGTRDFTPVEMARRNYIFDTIRAVFILHGYQPIETPAMENLSTLMGKYGEEGDKLLFRILNSGDYLKGVKGSGLRAQGSEHRTQGSEHRAQGSEWAVGSGQLAESGIRDLSAFTQHISEKGLRYDLTVPLARFVVQHQHNLNFPFKRFQIQPVWRADRPQKGRYREFFQCDVDVIGSDSLLYEIEQIQIVDEIFTRLDLPVTIRINNRKILYGISEAIGAADKLTDITIAMDKIDKIGVEKVIEELTQRGLTDDAITKLQPILTLDGKIKEKKAFLEELFNSSDTGKKGLDELCHVLKYLKSLDVRNKFEFDVRLARGLSYYTGTIIEVMARDVPMGSLCGGGRYDDLTGIFGLPGLSGVGISFGADRIYDVLLSQDLFPDAILSTTQLLLVNFGEEEERFSMQLLMKARKAGIPAEIYPEPVKLKKQLDYANRKQIPYVALAGKEEIESGMITLKNMKTGEQQSVSASRITEYIQ
ncbi:MAG: histidine--tRNA ligase [Bacteroidales bacterium]|nr:histidine--tRNA ligase [Bacteroidales bacterium]